MKNYKFTHDWFSSNDLQQFLDSQELNSKPISMLEIGSFEGKSTVWFLENILQNEKSTITCIDPWTSYSQDSNSLNSYSQENTEWDFKTHKDTFDYNIQESGFSDKTIAIQGFSHKILPQFLVDEKQFDIIFIDGNHVAPYVLQDAVLSWNLLNKEGIMIFDDYLWGQQNHLAPKPAIDSFCFIFQDYVKLIWDKSNRYTIQKIK